ncbi:MAG: hypothetical protein GWN79_25345, partial [Actinobacteria bacterium]|nr:hypothetical protein [Actinomycetota bacterium]NIT98548.1 hypothetical protein [Actinomycetota bacterium]NIU22175.1 hypothetical protein [Actinomycetota bacterium]NIU70710.1 hypothetical protein [Actinomycetota bacterium]NIV90297.1 hypothetical protein [Actinomycetota bacterium]
AAEPGAEAGAVEALAYAGAFLVLGVALLVAEFFLVSFGLLGAGALAAALVAVHFAFGAGPIAGWLFVLVSAVATVVIMRWGIRRIRRS